MSTSYKFFVLSFSLIFSFVLLSDSLSDIYGKCDSISAQCQYLNTNIQGALRTISDSHFSYVAYSNGYPVTMEVSYSEMGGMRSISDYLYRSQSNILAIQNDVGFIRQHAAELTSSSSGGSYDDTDLMAKLDKFEEVLNAISTSVDDIKQLVMDYMAWFTENQDKLTNYLDNWGNFTNSLPSSFFYNFLTNEVNETTAKQRNLFNGFPFFRYNYRTGLISPYSVPVGLGNVNPYMDDVEIDTSNIKSFSDLFAFLHYDLAYGFSGMGTTLYTNTVDTISFHRDFQKHFKSYSDFTTNKITEINSIFYNNSPLEDITTDVNPSNIYNFVTNYYIKVSTDPSGSASENKTNWFNRIEMLLTALVFRPQETVASNKFENATDSESQTFKDSLQSVLEGDISEIQGNSQKVLQDFEKTKTSLLKFFSHLDDKLSSLASIPSHIEFFEITTSSGDRKKVEIVTQGAFASYADTLRVISTLCWISFFVYVIFVLSRWLFVKFSTILKFCYSVFKTLIGIG